MQTHTNHAGSARWAGFRVNPECLNAIKEEAAKRGINEDKLAREFVEMIWLLREAIPTPVCLLASPEMTVAIEAAHAAAIDALFERLCALTAKRSPNSNSQPMHGASRGKYYTERAKDDYYANAYEKAGHWWGTGAERLGLSGAVDAAVFKNLLYGLSPDGAQKLVLNSNDHEKESDRQKID